MQCRQLLYEMSDTPENEEPPASRPTGWKKACSSVLALDVSVFNYHKRFFFKLPVQLYLYTNCLLITLVINYLIYFTAVVH